MANPNWAPGTFFHLHEEDPVEAYENFKLGMWIFLATEVLLFGGIFAAYFIFNYKWPEIFTESHKLLDPVMGTLNTVVLLSSSLTMALGVDAAQRGKKDHLVLYLSLTFLGAVGFLIVKGFEWWPKITAGITPETNIFFFIYYLGTGLHALHVIIGMSFIAFVLYRAAKGRYGEDNFGGVEICGLYWHLVDIIWIFLFPLLYLI